MSPRAQRIAIAEACGWKFTKINGEFRYVAISPDGVNVHRADFGDVSPLPDYINDLNAMHVAEEAKFRWGQECVDYQSRLRDIEDRDQGHSGFMQLGCHSSAKQRAEAFLRELKLWDDSK